MNRVLLAKCSCLTMMTLESKSCISWNSDDSDMLSSHWGTESSPGIERVWAASRQWRQLRALPSIDRQAYCVIFDPRFEAMNQSRS